jgi:lipoate-protein ligase A
MSLPEGNGEPPRIGLLDLTLSTPEENLALDEALLAAAETGSGPVAGRETLRFWESPSPFVVLGVSEKLSGVKLAACEAAGAPILRRSSGGGTVVQGPGCLNYALVLSLEARPVLRDVTRGYAEVLGRVARALGPDIEPAGTSDLAHGGMKVSGNSQKRTRRWLLHHGTVLLGFDLSLIERFLEEPNKQPDYRQGRAHRAFVRNLDLPREETKSRIAGAWNATPALAPPIPDLGALIAERHGNPEWIRRF